MINITFRAIIILLKYAFLEENMAKKILYALTLIFAFIIFTYSVFGAEVTVNASTSLQDAIKSLNGNGGTVIVAEDVTVSGEVKVPAQSADITFTGKTITLSADISFEKGNGKVTFDLPINVRGRSAVRILGGFNSVVFTENFEVTGLVDFYGGVRAHETEGGPATYNEYENKMNEAAIAKEPYSITVNGGTFNAFSGGNFRATYSAMLGSIAAPIDITINGGTFGGEVSFNADSALKLDKAFSISGMSILADNATLTINGGTFNCPIYAQGYIGPTSVRTSGDSQVTNSDAKYYAADGDIKININGGTFNGCEINATQRAASYSQLLRGNYTVTVDKKAKIADGTVFDATQVKAYAGKTEKATLTFNASAKATVKRFDVVNGKAQKYEEPLRIAFIGDSITQGANAYVGSELSFETKAYPAQFLEKAVANGKDVQVSNYGCSATKIINYEDFGYTLGLAYTLSMKETDADYVVVGLGTNDSLALTYTYGMKDRFTEEYTDFISGYEALPETDMVFGTSAIYRDSRSAAAVAIRGLQEKVFASLIADGKKCTYIDLYALLLDSALGGDLLSSDLLHPDADGYTIYAEHLYDAIFGGVCEIENFEMSDVYVGAIASSVGTGTKESPTNSISVAFSKAASEATVYVSGKYNYTKLDDADCAFLTPTSVDKLTIKGEGEGGAIRISSKYFFINSDVTFDNITLESAYSPLYIVAGCNNVTFTDTFKCNGAVLVTGSIAYGDNKANTLYNSRESLCSDEQYTITVNGGNFQTVYGGNMTGVGRADALFGTFSGALTLNVGKNAVINELYAVGQNYFDGSVTVNVFAGAKCASIREYAPVGTSKEARALDPSKNTGTVTVNIESGATAAYYPLGDVTADGRISVYDALQMLRAIADRKQSTFANNFYGLSTLFTEENAKNLLRIAVK